MPSELDQLRAGIAALQARRDVLGDAVVEASIAGLQARLSTLSGADPGAVQTLRQVTIVFLDIVGSTTLSQHLDPEEVHAVIDGSLARCTAIVQAHGGKVLQYAGDNLLAVFGADEAHEDNAERALHCGLELLALGRERRAQVKRAHGHDGFDFRLGVHTGGVLLGGGVDAEGSIRGIAVNIAARMEQTAPVGSMRISHDTHALVRGLFDVEPQPPIAVKGVDEPIVSHLVLRARPRSFRSAGRGIEGIETPMIGRDVELATLHGAFARLRARRGLEVVTVLGEAGLGKSRMLAEFESGAGAGIEAAAVFRGRANPQTRGQPYGLLRDLLVRWLQIGDGDGLELARHKVESAIIPLFEADDGVVMAEAQAHLLGHLIGVDFADSRHVAAISGDPRQIRNRAFHAAAQILRRISAGTDGGALLLLEDLHWADDGTLDFLDHLVEVGRDAAVLVIALARPALLERRSAWGADAAVHRRIELAPLDAGSSRKLASELLRRLAFVPAELQETIVGRAEGNPFYMEELVKMLVDRGAIETSTPAWTLNPLLATEVPATLTGVLQARLDSLPRHERLALQHASVIGHVFWDRALAALDGEAPEALPALVRGRLVVGHPQSQFGDVREYAFSHQILHQVTYSTLLKRTRRELHARVAAWLAGLPRANDFLGATAEHYTLAGDVAQASRCFASAAEHAKSRFAHEVALAHVDRALSLLERSAATPESLLIRWRLLFVRESTFNMQGRRTEQPAVLDALDQVADALDDDRLRALAARRRSQFALRTADFALQESAARRAIAMAGRGGDVESRLEAQRLLADALNAQGDPEAAKALAREGLEEARSLGLRRVEGVFLNTLAYIATQQDDLVTGLALDLEDLPIWRELGDPFGEAIALGNVGADWLWFGQIEQARPVLDDALKLFRSVGARQLVCSPLANLSMLALWQGDSARALALANEALNAAVAVRAVDFEAQTLCRVGDAELALDRDAAAEAAFARAASVARGIGSAVEREAIAGLARVALARGDVASAMFRVDALLAYGDLEGAEARGALYTCWRVLDRAGDARAPGLLAAAYGAVRGRAATIGDPVLRASFLERVPDNQRVVQAWQAAHPGGLDPAPA